MTGIQVDWYTDAFGVTGIQVDWYTGIHETLSLCHKLNLFIYLVIIDLLCL